jgi:ATP-dependent phosphofructokinase / diphosphate-dependent phosphofructokinase
MKKSVVILCAGGPAPGMNTVVASVAKSFLANGYNVIGLNGGYGPLFKDGESENYLTIDYKMADRMFNQGGSLLRMSRYKPKDTEFKTDFFEKHNVKLLVTVGGDDTASTANRVAKFLEKNNLKVANIHVPKTIDNDLPLQEGVPTFGYHTAKETGTFITLTISEDARTNGTWFVLSAMGREAGHLAFGIGMACHAPMVIIPEMFTKVECTFDHIVKLMVSSIVKREILGIDYGVLIISEGVFHFISHDEIKNSGIHFSHDEHGHPELGTISKGQIFDTLLQRRLKELGIKIKSRPNDMGYELRCVRPIAFDLAYCTALGTGVYRLFSEGISGCMVTLNKEQQIVPLYLKDLEDPKTGKIQPRLLNMSSDRVKQYYNDIAHYITPDDYEAAKKYIKNPEDYDLKKILKW